MWLYFGLIAAILWIIILFSYIRVKFKYSRKHDNDMIQYEIKALLGIIQLSFEVPIIKFQGVNQGLEVKSDIKLENLETELIDTDDKITTQKAFNFYNQIKTLRNHVYRFSDWLFITLSKLKCTHLHWHTHIGIGEAPGTAVTTGIVWGIKTNLLGYVFKKIHLETVPEIQVNPEFNRSYFSTVLISEIKIRHFHAFLAPIRLLIRILKVKGGLRVWIKALYRLFLILKNKRKLKKLKEGSA